MPKWMIIFCLHLKEKRRETEISAKEKIAWLPCVMQSGFFSLACGQEYIRELKIETFSGRRQLQPDVTSSFVGYCACSCSPPCRRGPVGDVKLVCLALWRKREYLTFISIRFVAFSNQHFADYRS